MLKLIANIVLIFVLIRLLRPVVRAVAKRFSGGARSPEVPGPEPEVPYSDLTPYEIEDADYEEITREQ